MKRSGIFITLILISVLGIFYFCCEARGESGDLEEGNIGYTELVKKYEMIKRDRDNLLIQTKRLLEQKRSNRELEEDFEKKLQTDKELLEGEKNQILGVNQKLREEIKNLLQKLDESQVKLESERERFEMLYEEAKRGTRIKELEKTISELKKDARQQISLLKEENKKEIYLLKKEKEEEISALRKEKEEMISILEKENGEKLTSLKRESEEKISGLRNERDLLSKNLREAQRETDSLNRIKEKAEKDMKEMREGLDDFKKNMADAVEKNKALEKELEVLPKKFSEIARQNKMLIKQTAEMHYNLGVFYTKRQEYKRAITEFVKAIEINPQDAYAHFNLGYIYAEFLVDRKRAVDHFKNYLRLAKGDDKDVDWARKYLLTWETYEGKESVK